MKVSTIANELNSLAYHGRGIIIGKSADSKKAITAYFIMGRSVNSRNRIFVQEPDGIRTEAFDPSLMKDPHLIIYYPVRVLGNKTIVREFHILHMHAHKEAVVQTAVIDIRFVLHLTFLSHRAQRQQQQEQYVKYFSFHTDIITRQTSTYCRTNEKKRKKQELQNNVKNNKQTSTYMQKALSSPTDNTNLNFTTMAYVISDDCVACGTCIDECPQGAISEGEKYSINPDMCIDCGSCASVCPSEAIHEG